MEVQAGFRADRMIKIVKTRPSHIYKILRIGKEQWYYEDWITKKYLNNTIKNRGFHFTALVDNKVVGSIMVVELDIPKFWIFYFAVRKKYQRHGIGTALLNKATREMKKNEFLFVDLTYGDATGMKFYRKNKFKLMGRVKNWFEKGQDGILMAKKM